MKILFVHKSIPGQFRYLCPFFTKNVQNCQVAFLTEKEVIESKNMLVKTYKVTRDSSAKVHHYVNNSEKAILMGQAAFRTALEFRNEGFVPDIIVGHLGFGPMLYLQEAFPKAKMVHYFEWFYNADGTSHGFDPEVPFSDDNRCEVRTKNVSLLVELVQAKRGWVPTFWQKKQFPKEFHHKMKVLHDGVDVEFFKNDYNDRLILPRINLNLSQEKEIVTYVATGMERIRGFMPFMKAMSRVQKKNKNCHIIVVAENRTEYTRPLSDGRTYLQKALEENEFDLKRIHFTGRLSLEEYRTVIRNSKVHVYLTYPFILSWSMLEVMALGKVVVGSSTKPVEEVIKNNENGLLTDFFDDREIAEKVLEGLTDSKKNKKIKQNAKETIMDNYNLYKLLPKQVEIILG